jgi:hypothetical protein
MNDIIKKTKNNTRKAVAAGCLDITKEIIQRTPVDTGRLKGNWIPDINNIPDYSLDTYDKSGNKAISKASSETNKIQIGDIYFLINNLVYAPVAEYGLYPIPGGEKTINGYSTQAPAGMVRTTVEEADYLIQKAVKIHGDT